MSDDVVVPEVLEPLDHAAAVRLDKRVRLMATTFRENFEKLATLVEEAKRGEVYRALGFASWPAYVADVFKDQTIRLDRPQRRELVGFLSGEGMSQRVIAEVVNVDQKTVCNDLRAGEENSSPESGRRLIVVRDPAPATTTTVLPPAERAALEDGLRENREKIQALQKARTSDGRDGKTYPRPAPKTSRRRPITDDFRNLVLKARTMERQIRRLADVDRLARHQDLDGYRNDLIRLRGALDDLIGALDK